MGTDFNTFAGTWDTEYRIERARIIAREIKTVCDLNEHQNLMEFGCGTGLIGFHLVDSVHRIDCVDSSPEMVRMVREKANVLGYGHKMNVFPGLEALNRNCEYDCIYSSMVMHHVYDIEAVGREFWRRLPDSGRLCIVDLHPDDGSYHQNEKDFDGYHGFDPEELAGRLEGVGFRTKLHKTFFEDVREMGNQKVPYSLFILLMEKTASVTSV